MIIGVTGGIGSGKSVVCHLFKYLGAPIYDSDYRAKHLMTESENLRRDIVAIFDSESYINGELNRGYISSKIFSDNELLQRLNSVVHPAVARDFKAWATEEINGGAKYVVMESAILFESGFDKIVDKIIAVSAPIDIRVNRVMLRDGSTKKQIINRINSQMDESEKCAKADFVVINDDKSLLVPQILKLDNTFKNR